MRALAKDPAERFPSTAAFAEALLAEASPPPTRARRSTSTRPPGDSITTVVLPAPHDERHGYHVGRDARPLAAAEMDARHRVGEAIVHGDVGQIAERYVALARLLLAGGHARGAARELEEALDLLCAASSPCPDGDAVAQLLVALVPIYAALGDRVAVARTRARLDQSTTLTMSRP